MTGVDPVRKQIVVQVSQERAFRVFTEGIDRWWPRQHHIGSSPLKRAVLEPRHGGRWYSICEDGSECNVGRVLGWEPPTRLALAWQITAHWQYDPDFVTEIEVDFIAETPTRTRVEVVHQNLGRYALAASEHRKLLDSPTGWSAILAAFARCAEAGELE